VNSLIKKAIKAPFNALGMELLRRQPDPLPGIMRKCGIQTVLDVGAHVGEFAGEARKALPNAAIFSFEPIPECFTELVANMGRDPKFKAFQLACGQKSETTQFRRFDGTARSSVLPMTGLMEASFPGSGLETQIKVEVRPLDAWAAEIRMSDPIMLKIDVQGFEAQVLRGATRTLERCALVYLEVSVIELYEGQALLPEIDAILTGAGFSMMGFSGMLPRSAATGLYVQADAVYRRSPAVKAKP